MQSDMDGLEGSGLQVEKRDTPSSCDEYPSRSHEAGVLHVVESRYLSRDVHII